MEISVLGNPESIYENLRTYNPNIPTDGAQLAVNRQFFAYLDTTGSGASIAVLPLTSYGKNHIPVSSPAYQQPLIRAHSQIVQDFAFSPFNHNVLYSCAADKTMKLWDIPAGGLSIDLMAPKYTLSLSSKVALRGLSPHTSAANILALRGSREVALVDTAVGKELLSMSSTEFTGDILSLSWSYNGDLLYTAAKDRKIRMFDLRTSRGAVQSCEGHAGPRYGAVHSMGESPYFLSAGHNAADRQIFVWDSRALDAPVYSHTVDQANTNMKIVYDCDANLMFQSGKGDSLIRAFSPTLELLTEQSISTDAFGKDLVRGLSLLPKEYCNKTNEITRILKLSDNIAQVISVVGENAINEVLGDSPALSSEEWLAGANSPPVRIPYTPPVTVESVVIEEANNNSEKVTETTEELVASTSKRLSTRAQSMSSLFRYKHLHGLENKREFTAFGLSPDCTALDNPIIACNEDFYAMPYLRGGGGPIYISKIDSYGRVPHDCPTLNGHKGAVQDLSFSPFSSLLISGAADSTIKLWETEKMFADQKLVSTDCLSTISTSSVVKSLLPHPAVNNLLATTNQDQSIRLFDLTRELEVANMSLMDDGGLVTNMSYNYNGSLLAIASKDKLIRVVDPRLNSVVQCGSSAEHLNRNVRVTWCSRGSDSDPIACVSASSHGLRYLSLYDARQMTKPLAIKSLDNASGQLFSLFDEGLNVLFVVGKGDTTLRAFELNSSVDGVLVDKVMEFQSSIDPFAGVCMLPKRACNVEKVEVGRVLKMTSSSVIECKFFVPRAEHLKSFFHDDIYLPVRSKHSSVSVEEYMEGEKELTIERESLQPLHMKKVSERPADPLPSEANSKVRAYEESKKKAADEEKQREEAFQKLQQLAVQNAMYRVNLSGGKKIGGEKVVVEEEEDSDGGWDD